MSAINYLCDNVVVLYGGKVLEKGVRETVLKKPAHPYTQALLQAVPRLNGPKQLTWITGTVPSIFEEKKGCIFASRCSFKQTQCKEALPKETILPDGHTFSCFHPIVQTETANKKKEAVLT